MGYCHIHGKHDNLDFGCPDCQTAEDQASSDRSAAEEKLGELIEAQRDAAHKTTNPGDYVCPFCRFQTLLIDASRCFKCQKDIPTEFWRPIREREAEQRKRRAEEAERWRLDEPKRIEAEKRRTEAELKASLAREGEKQANTALWLSLGGLLCCTPLSIAALVYGVKAILKLDEDGNKNGSGKAIASLVISSLSISFTAIWIVIKLFGK